MLKLLRNHYKNGSTREPVPPEPFQEAKEGIGRAYAPLFPGFSGVFMENKRYSYDVI